MASRFRKNVSNLFRRKPRKRGLLPYGVARLTTPLRNGVARLVLFTSLTRPRRRVSPSWLSRRRASRAGLKRRRRVGGRFRRILRR